MKHKVFIVLEWKKKVEGEQEEVELLLLVAEEEFRLVQWCLTAVCPYKGGEREHYQMWTARPGGASGNTQHGDTH